ncbi:MAG: HAD family hydrolase [archaeon]
MENKAVFLDRDGVINEDRGYVHKTEDFKILPRVFEALKKIKKAGYRLIIITNQSGIGLGYYSEQDYLKITENMVQVFKKQNIEFDDILYCPHDPDKNCDCRKPSTKLFLDSIKKFSLSPEKCWIVGDKLTDIKPAEKLGCKAVLIESRYTEKLSIQKTKDLYESVKVILQENESA